MLFGIRGIVRRYTETLATSQDGWMQIFRNFEKYREDDQFTYASACIFFIITILTAAFIIANLMVAVVTTNLDRCMQEMKVPYSLREFVTASG